MFSEIQVGDTVVIVSASLSGSFARIGQRWPVAGVNRSGSVCLAIRDGLGDRRYSPAALRLQRLGSHQTVARIMEKLSHASNHSSSGFIGSQGG